MVYRVRSGLLAAAAAAALSVLVLAQVGHAAVRRGGGTHKLANVRVPATGAYWGSFVDERLATVAGREAQLGEPFGIVHFYDDWFGRWGGPGSEEKRIADTGQILFVSIDPWDYRSGAIVPWRSIADGSQDARIDRLADDAKRVGHPMFIGFHEEAESDVGRFGTAADFVAAFRHIVDRFRADGVRNVSWVWQSEGWLDYYQLYPSLYPGDRFVDWIAWDPYNWGSCRSQPWKSFAQIVKPFYSWLTAHGHGNKPFMLGEYGTVDPGGFAKQRWFAGALATMRSGRFRNLKALVYFDSPKDCGTWRLDSSQASLRGFASMGASRFFRP